MKRADTGLAEVQEMEERLGQSPKIHGLSDFVPIKSAIFGGDTLRPPVHAASSGQAKKGEAALSQVREITWCWAVWRQHDQNVSRLESE